MKISSTTALTLNCRRSYTATLFILFFSLMTTSFAYGQSSLILWEKTIDVDVDKTSVWFTQSNIVDNGNLVLAGSGTSDSSRHRSRQKKLNFAAMLSPEGKVLWKTDLNPVTIVPTSKIISNLNGSLSFLGYTHVNSNYHAPIKSSIFDLKPDGTKIGNKPSSEDLASENIIHHADDTYTHVKVYEHVHHNPKTEVLTFERIYKKKNGKNGKNVLKKIKRLKEKSFSIPLGWTSSVKKADGTYVFAGIETAENPRGRDSYYLTSIKTDETGGVIKKTRIQKVNRSAKVVTAINDETDNTVFLMLNSDSFGNRISTGVLTIVDNKNFVVSSKETKSLKWIAHVDGDGFIGGSGSTFSKFSRGGKVEWTKSLKSDGVSINTGTQDSSGKAYLSGERRGKAFVAAVSMSAISENVVFNNSLARQYFVNNLKNIDDLKQYYSDVVANCNGCDLDEITSSSIKFTEGSPASAREFIFKPYFEQLLFSQNATMMYIGNQVGAVSDIPNFTAKVLSLCSGCDQELILKRLYHVHGFGETLADNFFDSTEYNFVLQQLPYEETVEAYFKYAVNDPQKFETFFTTILPKCESKCDKTSYAKRAIKSLDTDYLNIDIGSFHSSTVFKYAVAKTAYEVDSKTNKDVYSLRLKSAGRTFKQEFSGNCAFSRKATKVKDAWFLDTLLTGADARRNYYDVYQCNLSNEDWSTIEAFSSSVKKSQSVSKLKQNSKWDYYKFTGDERIVYERAPSTYTPQLTDGSSVSSYSPSSSSSSSKSSSEQKRGVRNVQNNGMIGGNPSSAIECLSGGRHIVYRKNGTWYTGGGGHMGNKYNSWSVQEIANEKCE